MPRFKVPRDNIEITAVIADIGDIDSHELKINHNEVKSSYLLAKIALCSIEWDKNSWNLLRAMHFMKDFIDVLL